MTSPDKIVVAAMRIRMNAPALYEDLVLAFREYSAGLAMEMVRVPTENLPTVQGMARCALDLSSVLMEAPALYEKMQARPKK